MNQTLKSIVWSRAAELEEIALPKEREISSWRNPKEHLVPSTFEERGTSVPFTTPALLHARARLSWRGKLELAIGRFAASNSFYVVPWQNIRELIQLTVHDLMLHESVLKHNAVDPHSMRHLALEVATSGLAGPENAKAAKFALAADDEAKALNHVMLILAIIKQVEKTEAERLFREARSPEGQDRIREALSSISQRVSEDVADFERNLYELGERTYAVGISWSPKKGRLRQLAAQIASFKKSTASWGLERLGEASDQAKFCAAAAAHTLSITTKTLEKFDAAIKNPLTVLSQWQTKMVEIDRLTLRLSWLLDGWEPILEAWSGAETEYEQVEALASIVNALPIVPKNEVGGSNDSGLPNDLTYLSKRWVYAHEDWRTGELDMDMVHRIELMRAKSRERR